MSYFKKIISFILVVFLIFVPFFSACSSNYWKLVTKITITTSGVEKVFTSSITNHFGSPTQVAVEEFSKYNSTRNLQNNDDKKVEVLSREEVSKKTNGATSYSYSEPLLKGYWYYIAYASLSSNIFYMKKPYSRTSYSLVYVKVINDTTIKIKTSKGETTYKVTSYSIR